MKDISPVHLWALPHYLYRYVIIVMDVYKYGGCIILVRFHLRPFYIAWEYISIVCSAIYCSLYKLFPITKICLN